MLQKKRYDTVEGKIALNITGGWVLSSYLQQDKI